MIFKRTTALLCLLLLINLTWQAPLPGFAADTSTKATTNPAHSLILNKNTATYLKKGVIPGFGGIKFDMTKKQIASKLGKPVSSFYHYGGEFWIFKNISYAGFNFENPYTGSNGMWCLLIGKEAFPNKTFADVKKHLGSAYEMYYNDMEEEYEMVYTFDKVRISFMAETPKAEITLVQISR
ncbi:hypothetical protein NYE54_31170 [Paenibacillus sp. FSL K6-1330]|uniref:hypothetical protein n=1 Tax=Paenibacillus sp. FSL K6-1330 TaxID=2975292 RepID=UPI0030D8A78A